MTVSRLTSGKLYVRENIAVDKTSKRHYLFKTYRKTESSTFIQKDSYITGGPSSYKFTYYGDSYPTNVSYVSLNEDVLENGKRLVHNDVKNSSVKDSTFYSGTNTSGGFRAFLEGDLYETGVYGSLEVVIEGSDSDKDVDFDASKYEKYRNYRNLRFVLTEAFTENSKGEKVDLVGFDSKVAYSQLNRVDRKVWASSYFDYEIPPFKIVSDVCEAL